MVLLNNKKNWVIALMIVHALQFAFSHFSHADDTQKASPASAPSSSSASATTTETQKSQKLYDMAMQISSSFTGKLDSSGADKEKLAKLHMILNHPSFPLDHLSDVFLATSLNRENLKAFNSYVGDVLAKAPEFQIRKIILDPKVRNYSYLIPLFMQISRNPNISSIFAQFSLRAVETSTYGNEELVAKTFLNFSQHPSATPKIDELIIAGLANPRLPKSYLGPILLNLSNRPVTETSAKTFEFIRDNLKDIPSPTRDHIIRNLRAHSGIKDYNLHELPQDIIARIIQLAATPDAPVTNFRSVNKNIRDALDSNEWLYQEEREKTLGQFESAMMDDSAGSSEHADRLLKGVDSLDRHLARLTKIREQSEKAAATSQASVAR